MSQVVGSFRYGEFAGKFDGKNRKKSIIAYIAFVAFCVVDMTAILVGYFLTQVSKPDANENPIGMAIAIVVVCLMLPAIFSVFVVRHEILRKKILKCSEDAVEVYAYSKCVGEQTGRLFVAFAKIQVSFELNGKHHIIISGKNRRLGTDEGYSRVWLQYRDRAIRILYSPRYDEVIVLKDI